MISHNNQNKTNILNRNKINCSDRKPEKIFKRCLHKKFYIRRLRKGIFYLSVFAFLILLSSTAKQCNASSVASSIERTSIKNISTENEVNTTSTFQTVSPEKFMETVQQELAEQAVPSPKKKQEDKTVSLSVRNASMQEVAAALSRMSGKNIAAENGSSGFVTLDLKDVSLPTALDILATSQGITYFEKDGVTFLAKDDTARKQAAGFYSFPLNYVRAEDVQKPLAAILNGGKIAAAPESNTLLFNGSPAEARKIKETLQQMDKATQQVTLEAKIVSIEKSEESNLGLQWNWDTLPQYSTYNNNESGSSGHPTTNTASDSKHQGHLDLWNKTKAQFRFTATLNALITSGKAKVLATPSLITLPGKEASIFIGSHIPVVTEKHNNGESTYSTEYVDAGIKLKYTPIVSRDGYITSVVHTEVSTPTLISELKNYRINSRTADTNVRMRNGETLVIGGLISEEEQKQLQQIPFLSKIPLLGELFKNRYRSKSKTEVVMLLTPYLSDAGKSPAIYGERETLFQNVLNS